MTSWELLVIGLDPSGTTRGIILTRSENATWNFREELQIPMAQSTRVSSFLCGDGSALIALLSPQALSLLAPEPWSWDQWDREIEIEGGWGFRYGGCGGQERERYARRWSVIRSVQLSTGTDDARTTPLTGNETKPKGIGHVGWVCDGSVVASVGNRTVLLSSGIYQPPRSLSSQFAVRTPTPNSCKKKESK